MDAAFWTLDLGFPSRIEAETTKVFPETAPRVSRIVYEFPARGSRSAVRVVWRDGELGAPRPPDLPPENAWPAYADVGAQLWIGSDGSLVADAYGDKILLLDAKRHAELTAGPPAEKYARTQGAYAEWIAACKGGPAAGSSFAEHSGPLTQMVLLGNLAVRMGRVLELDPKSGRVTNAQVPAEYLTPAYRKGWAL